MFDRPVKDLSRSYNVEENIVIDALKSSIEEILTKDFGYKVNAEVRDDIVNLVAEVNQHGNTTYQELALTRIKTYHIAEITKLLQFKLYQNEARELYNRYSHLNGKLVKGKILKKIDRTCLIQLDRSNLIATDIIAFCNEDFIFKKDLESKDSKYYQIIHISVVREENICKLEVIVSRFSKRLPVLILEELDPANKSKHIKCLVRHNGKSSLLKSDTLISKDNLAKLQSEFYGEYFKVIVNSNKAVING